MENLTVRRQFKAVPTVQLLVRFIYRNKWSRLHGENELQERERERELP